MVGITGSPQNKDIDRTALGATESIDWEHVSSISKIEKELKEEGWKIALIEQTDESIKLQNFNPKSDENLHLYLVTRFLVCRMRLFSALN